MTTVNTAYGTYTALTVTNLHSLANDSTDPYSSWQSDRVDNQTSVKAVDFEVYVSIDMANTSPANDQAGYLYLVPWMYNGSSWVAGGNFGTTTLPTGSEGTASISDPNSMRGPIVLPYKVADQNLTALFSVAALCGGICPDGWSLAFRTATGAAVAASGSVIAYRSITYTNA